MLTKKILWGLVYLFASSLITTAQETEFKPHGKVNGKIFANFNSTLSGPNPSTGFEVQRAYFGYKYQLSPEFSAAVKLDIGSPENDPNYELLKRYAYFKTAALYYKKDKLKIGFGLMDTYQFKNQEKLWGKRYIYRSFQDAYGFGQSADIGMNIQYTLGMFTFDAGFYNGEGYKTLQKDDSFLGTFGVTVKPVDFLKFRVYGDMQSKDAGQETIGAFAGLELDRFNLGAEYNYKHNYKFHEDQNRFGFSVYGDYEVTDKWHLFGRYDKIDSNILDGQETPWNLAKDGSAIIGGIEYSPIKNVHCAVNYQDWYPAATNIDNHSAIYLNVEVVF
ncbi:porin [Marinilabiliaceae bacterium JC017]|nr:porin [Marinilabiliaceae bacterium JC017]